MTTEREVNLSEGSARSAELNEETGLGYYGASSGVTWILGAAGEPKSTSRPNPDLREYDQNKYSIWLIVDPLAMEGHNMTMSPYQFADNNPVNLIDPDGTSTWVTDNEDGTFTVVGGDFEDGDKNIYVVTPNEDGTFNTNYLSIGESMTTHAFVDEHDNFVVGAIIDLGSTEATDIINDIKENTPSIAEYVANWGDYNYKGDENTKINKYRGRLTPDGEIASMRDVGNYVAGYVSGRTFKKLCQS